MMDIFLYSGELRRGSDLKFIDFVAKQKASDAVKLVLVSFGGSPDAAYKIGRYLQANYTDFSVFVPGFCKSAGTLLAIAANDLIISPYGELGPLDIQMTKTDRVAGMDSGLNISEAFIALENRAKETFHNLVQEIITQSGGVVSFHTASHSASEIVSSLYGPIFGKFDPEEVGSRARAMRIGEDYGKRLNEKFKNLKPGGLDFLSQSYSSHGFVIDKNEASLLFNRVREATDEESALVESVGQKCVWPDQELVMENLSALVAPVTSEGDDVSGTQEEASTIGNTGTATKRRAKGNGANPEGASGAERAAPEPERAEAVKE